MMHVLCVSLPGLPNAGLVGDIEGVPFAILMGDSDPTLHFERENDVITIHDILADADTPYYLGTSFCGVNLRIMSMW